MKILFVCGSLEPGRDGVGDYVRLLAAEVIRQGHLSSAISLNEKKLTISKVEVQFSGSTELQVLRIPDGWQASKRFTAVKDFARHFDPNIVSFHFVPYSFNKKGISFEIGRQLKKACGNCNFQIMFHELWVGRDKAGDWKRPLVSAIQRLAVRRMISDLSPVVIHTHLPVFDKKLKELGKEAKQLPLYSNIEVVTSQQVADSKLFRVGFFSQVDTSDAIMNFLNILAEKASQRGLNFEIVLIGGSEEKMAPFANIFGTLQNLSSPVRCTGFLSDTEVSYVVQSCTIGITSTPRHALGKGSSIATLIGHGLPVAAPNIDRSYGPDEIGFFSEDLRKTIITEPDFDQIESAATAARAAVKKMTLAEITATFLFDLNAAYSDVN